MLLLPDTRVLVVAPHPDDEVLGCGGLIARFCGEKILVAVCVAGYRVYNHTPDMEEAREQAYALQVAAKILSNGVGYRINTLACKDEEMGQKLIDTAIKIESTVHHFKPTMVFLPWKGDTNQDHKAVHHAGIIATKQVPNIFCYEVPSSTEVYSGFVPNFYMPMTADVLEKKVEAMLCYKREMREYPHPRSANGLCSWAEKRGMECGHNAAEAFMMIRGVYG